MASTAELPLPRAYLFDDDGIDRAVEVTGSLLGALGERQLLWIDVDLGDAGAVRRVAQLLELEDATVESLLQPFDRPRVTEYGRYFHVGIFSVRETDDGFAPVEVDCVVGPHWVVTGERGESDTAREAFRARVGGDTGLGRLQAPSFLVTLLDWHLNAYFRALESLEAKIDGLDQAMLVSELDDDLLPTLVELRSRVSQLRSILAPHREVFADLSRPDFALSHSDALGDFGRLNDRLERAVSSLESLREMIIGSFEVLMTVTAHRTNEVMKVLTVTSVLLLPPTLIAAIFGMSFRLGVFESTLGFALVVAAMVVVGLGALAFVKRRGWL